MVQAQGLAYIAKKMLA